MASLGSWSAYEWDVEEVTSSNTDDHEEGEVLDHFHQLSAHDCLTFCKAEAPAGSKWEIALVLDTQSCRSWAYVDMDTMELPQYFEDAYGCRTRKVPQRFLKEFAKALS